MKLRDILFSSLLRQMNTTMIRVGRPSDVPGALELVKELAEYERAPLEVTNTVEEMLADGFGEKPIYGLFVAERESVIVGIAIHYVRYSTWKGKIIHLEDLVVKDKMRGTGLGYALYSEIIKQAKLDNVRRIDWHVLDWNTSAIDFYEKSGAKVLKDWYLTQMDEEGINYFIDNRLK